MAGGGGFNPKSVSARNADLNAAAREYLRIGAWAVVALYGVGVLYKSGVISALLRAATKLEASLERLKSKTEPLEVTKVNQAVRNHLLKSYGFTGALWTTSAIGSVLFFRFPHIPIGVPIATSSVPLGLVLFTSPETLRTPVRVASALLGSLSLGYCFGPLNWVAYDTLAPFASLVASTVTGFCVGLYLTRGTISYFLSMQLLSLSLSICSTTALARGSGNARVNAKVNAMLTVQLLANFALGVFHTVPTVAKFTAAARGQGVEALNPDPIREATVIFGCFAYSAWRIFRQMCLTVLRRILTEEPLAMTAEERRRSARRTRVSRWSGIGGGIIFLLGYAQLVSRLQSTGTQQRLDRVRQIFAAISPVRAV